MSNKEVLKTYSLEIDFLDYNKKESVSRNIVYSEGDVNTAFIDAKLTIGGEKIELNDCIITVGIKNNRGKNLSNTCKILNEQEGLIRIPFNKSFLSKIGFNKFEIIIYKKDKKLVSPTYVYRVTESFTDNEGIEESENYDVLLVLISQVQEIIDNTRELNNSIQVTNQEINANEEIRKTNELQRIENEKVRQSNEENRQLQENNRQNVFSEKITEINEITSIAEEKLTNLDSVVENTINTKLDSKIEEVNIHVDTVINEKFLVKSEEIDLELSQKLSENDKKIEDKLNETSSVIQNANLKIQEIDETIRESVNRFENKILEVDTAKTQLVEEVNNKIIEVDTTKTNLTNSINDKMSEFENRFNELELLNPAGEVIKSRISIDGNTHASLSERLRYDYNKKVDRDSVYTKSEIDTKEEQVVRNMKGYTDEKVANLVGQSPELLDTLEELSTALGNDPNFATTVANQIGQKADKESVYSKEEIDRLVSNSSSIDDANVSRLTTWSSEKIQEEIRSKVVRWDDIVGKPTLFNPTEHNHNNIYYQKSETDSFLEPIGNDFIDSLFTSPSARINGVEYYNKNEIDEKINMLISMIEKISK